MTGSGTNRHYTPYSLPVLLNSRCAANDGWAAMKKTLPCAPARMILCIFRSALPLGKRQASKNGGRDSEATRRNSDDTASPSVHLRMIDASGDAERWVLDDGCVLKLNWRGSEILIMP